MSETQNPSKPRQKIVVNEPLRDYLAGFSKMGDHYVARGCKFFVVGSSGVESELSQNIDSQHMLDVIDADNRFMARFPINTLTPPMLDGYISGIRGNIH